MQRGKLPKIASQTFHVESLVPVVQSEARPAKQRFQVAAAVESAGNLGGE